MTLAQAEALRDSQNAQLGELADIAKMYVFPYWDVSDFSKQYDTVMLPFLYNTEIGAADDSKLIAFKRVANATFAAGGWANLDDYVDVYTTQAAEDEELAAYLGL